MSLANTTRIYGNKIDKAVSEWLYGDWNEAKYNKFKALYGIPGVRDYFDYLLDKRADNEYFNRYGMSFDDIHDPRKLSQTTSAGRMISTGYRMVSRNVGSLYRNNVVYRRPRNKRNKRR